MAAGPLRYLWLLGEDEDHLGVTRPGHGAILALGSTEQRWLQLGMCWRKKGWYLLNFQHFHPISNLQRHSINTITAQIRCPLSGLVARLSSFASCFLGSKATDAIKTTSGTVENMVGPWKRQSLAQGELLGDNFSPFSFKASLMGPCKGWRRFGSAHTCPGNMGLCVSPSQDQCHGHFWG